MILIYNCCVNASLHNLFRVCSFSRRRRGPSGTALDYDAEGAGFESHSGRWLEKSACSPSNKWVPDPSWGRLGSKERGMSSGVHMLCPRHGGALFTRRPYDQQGYGILDLYLNFLKDLYHMPFSD